MSFPIPAYYDREHSKMTKVLNHLLENLGLNMNLLSLPDEIFCQICNHLNIFDFLSLVKIPEFGLRAQKFYRFYYDGSHRECKRFGEQELKKRHSLEAYP